MAYVIAVANQKGGVAKTTSVVSLGGALAQLGKEVLLIDMDAQANLTLAMGFDPSHLRLAVADVLLNSATVLSASRETAVPGLDLLPSNSDMDLAERFLSVRQNYETILQDALRGIVAYDIVLIDCPPAMGCVTINALVAADLLVIPTQPEYFSAHALRAMMRAIRRVRNLHNPNLEFRVLITMQDRRNRIHRDLSDQIRSTFNASVLETVIETDTRLRESSVAGLPITYYRNHTRSAQQYIALAQELNQYVEEKDSTPA